MRISDWSSDVCSSDLRDRYDAVASRLKLISGMDIAERRLPQDGRMSTRVGGQEMDIRVSALPGVHGESIVIRLLPKERKGMGLDKLGFARDHQIGKPSCRGGGCE